MRPTDIRARDASVVFREVRLAQPFVISGRPIDVFTVAEVTLEVETRDGRRAHGHGQSVLSVPWAWPHGPAPVTERDRVLRDLVRRYAEEALHAPAADPVETWRLLTDGLDGVLATAAGPTGGAVPRLAGLLAVGAVDNALHDAWGRAAGRSSLAMADAEHLSTDLSWLDAELRGAYPADGLRQPARRLGVQHVVGVGDPLTPREVGDGTDLTTWLRRERPPYLKVKVVGADPAADAERVVAVHDVAARHLERVTIAVDPNEGCPTPDVALQLLEEIAQRSPATARAVDYLEQPVPRSSSPVPVAMRGLAGRVPTVLDEGFDRLTQLLDLADQGWSGVVLKASKGQTPALVAAAVARRRGLWCVVQDLTASSWALAHSARLVAELPLTRRHLEFNSRQYAPGSNVEFSRTYPELVTVEDGAVRLPAGDGTGLYGFG